MREYKFRAWDKTREEMINVDMLLNTENGMQQYRVTRPLVNGCLDVEFAKEDTILMQYIGLKDKNKDDIYESDIIKITTESNSWISKVGNHGVWHEIIVNDLDLDIDFISINYAYDVLDCEIEVIGNIYENPELLN